MVIPNPALPQLPSLSQHKFKRRDLMPLGNSLLWQIDVGVVRTSTWNEEGTLVTLGFWGPGDIVGQPISQINPYQIECLTTVEAWILPVDCWNFHQAMLSHIQQTEELLKIIHCKHVECRLLQFLNWLARRFGREVAQGQLIDLPLTHQDIAQDIGTTRVTVTRLLNRFKQEGKIILSGQRCILLTATIPQSKWHPYRG